MNKKDELCTEKNKGLQTMDITKFMITDKQYLKISHVEKLTTVDGHVLCTYIDITYVNEEKNITMLIGSSETNSFVDMMTTSQHLVKVLEGSAVYDKAVHGDLGFLYNQYCENVTKFLPYFKYCLSTRYDRKAGIHIKSWLYNDKNGNIIFEITPIHPWDDQDLQEDPRRITYKEFMKNYQPILQMTIAQKNIEQWIKQGEELKKYCSMDTCCDSKIMDSSFLLTLDAPKPKDTIREPDRPLDALRDSFYVSNKLRVAIQNEQIVMLRKHRTTDDGFPVYHAYIEEDVRKLDDAGKVLEKEGLVHPKTGMVKK